jgi:hypothetical protein
VRRSVVLLACLLVAACGAGEPAGDEAARHLDPRSDAVVAIDLDYDGGNWQQIKRLYERSVAASGSEDRGFPDTFDALLEELAGEAGLSFDGDVRPLLGGTLNIGVRVEPAPASDASRSCARTAPTPEPLLRERLGRSCRSSRTT